MNNVKTMPGTGNEESAQMSVVEFRENLSAKLAEIHAELAGKTLAEAQPILREGVYSLKGLSPAKVVFSAEKDIRKEQQSDHKAKVNAVKGATNALFAWARGNGLNVTESFGARVTSTGSVSFFRKEAGIVKSVGFRKVSV